MAKITYLFGAGASYGALPIVDEIPTRLQALIELLEKPEMQLADNEVFPKYKNIDLQYSKQTYQKRIIDDLKWIYDASSKHASIDTFAKKLFLKQQEDSLFKLKATLSVFFVFEQAINPTNDRYDAFFASILDNQMKIPNDIKILSWNYDYQFEKAFSQFIDETHISILQDRLRIQSKNVKCDYNFSIYKLNGTTSIYDGNPRGGFNFTHDVNTSFSKTLIDQITQSYALITNPNSHWWQPFSFAWEDNFFDSDYVAKIVSQIENSAALVVIGYSFPFFNREIDKAIISRLNSLQKVYIQAPDAKEISERFASVKPDFDHSKIIPIINLKQFFLPNEL